MGKKNVIEYNRIRTGDPLWSSYLTVVLVECE
jgi:hypothetical protein